LSSMGTRSSAIIIFKLTLMNGSMKSPIRSWKNDLWNYGSIFAWIKEIICRTGLYFESYCGNSPQAYACQIALQRRARQLFVISGQKQAHNQTSRGSPCCLHVKK
jgi:hypothetical protein